MTVVFFKLLGEKFFGNILQIVLGVVHQGIKQFPVVNCYVDQMVFLISRGDLTL